MQLSGSLLLTATIIALAAGRRKLAGQGSAAIKPVTGSPASVYNIRAANKQYGET